MKNEEIVQDFHHNGRRTLVNVVAVGRSNVGKSTLLRVMAQQHQHRQQRMDSKTSSARNWLVNGLFQSDLYERRVVTEDGKEIVVKLWDTMGMENFTVELARTYVRSANAVLICFDISNRESFLDVPALYDFVCSNAFPETTSFFLVATKLDMASRRRQVSLDEYLSLARKLNLTLFESSALHSPDILETHFMTVVNQVLQRDHQFQVLEDPARIRLEDYNLITPVVDRGCWPGSGKKRPPPTKTADSKVLLDVLASQWVEVQAAEIITGVTRLKNASQNPPPISSSITNGGDPSAAKQERVLREGERFCPLGCKEIIPDRASAYYDHIDLYCIYRKVSCPLGCGERLRFFDSKQHVQDACPERVVICPGCGELVKANALARHQARYNHFNISLWSMLDVSHFLFDTFGREAAREFYNADEALSIVGKSFVHDKGLAVAQVADLLSTIGAKEISDAIEPYLVANLPTKTSSEAPSANEYLSPTRKENRDSSKVDVGDVESATVMEQTVSHASSYRHDGSFLDSIANFDRSLLNNQTDASAQPNDGKMLSAIADFDRSKLKKQGESSSDDKANNGNMMSAIANFDRSKLKKQGESSSDDKANNSNMMSAIANFDRSKLKKQGESSSDDKANNSNMMSAIANFDRSKLKTKGNENENSNTPNHMMVAIANFDRSKLKKNRNGQRSTNVLPTKTSNNNNMISAIANFNKTKLRHVQVEEKTATKLAGPSNSLFDSLAAAIERRRQVIQDEESVTSFEDNEF